jgi:hypothetical protein
MQQNAHGFDVFVPDGFGLIVDHFAEVLVTHSQLFVEPVFCLALLLQKTQNI